MGIREGAATLVASVLVGACGNPGISDPGAGGQGGAPTGDASAADVSYTIDRYIGGYDRVIITKQDRASDYCIGITLVSPDSRTLPGFQSPPNWGLEGVVAADSAGACGRSLGIPETAQVSGSVAWAVMGKTNFPCSVDLDVMVALSQGAHVPAHDWLVGAGLPAPCER